ncbi:MAG: AraC family transcriptional regulator [Sphingobacteriales bacterium]|nr:MAG: AraC family transcriptional regulator [Sphingobacteriales bacterium]
MKFTRISPHEELSELIECYWMMEDDNTVPNIQKIVPDGFTEIIFNYGSVYQANMNGNWQLQAHNLLAGQINSYFYLQNTSNTASFAIKLKPAALSQLFGLNMEIYLDKIVDLDTFPHPKLEELSRIFLPFENEETLKNHLNNHFLLLKQNAESNPLENEIALIFKSNGSVTVGELCEAGGKNERQLQRLFKRWVGLSPKYYSRIIRFNYIFQLVKEGQMGWSELVYRSGYYDQSHFIRDFKRFTGEDPSTYGFEHSNMANFFLNK